MIFGLTTSQFVILNHMNIITNDIYVSKLRLLTHNDITYPKWHIFTPNDMHVTQIKVSNITKWLHKFVNRFIRNKIIIFNLLIIWIVYFVVFTYNF